MKWKGKKIYVASSWANDGDPLDEVHQQLRVAGFETLDFRRNSQGDIKGRPDPTYGHIFNPEGWSVYEKDKAMMEQSDGCFVLMPAGSATTLEAGYFAGKGKPTVVFGSPRAPLDITWRLLDSGNLFCEGPIITAIYKLQSLFEEEKDSSMLHCPTCQVYVSVPHQHPVADPNAAKAVQALATENRKLQITIDKLRREKEQLCNDIDDLLKATQSQISSQTGDKEPTLHISNSLRDRVLFAIAATNQVGATVDGLCRSFGLSRGSISSRVSELSRAGKISAYGTRQTASGRKAKVWVAEGN